jgi:hypothetical protein
MKFKGVFLSQVYFLPNKRNNILEVYFQFCLTAKKRAVKQSQDYLKHSKYHLQCNIFFHQKLIVFFFQV